jgi:hypothetical protein
MTKLRFVGRDALAETIAVAEQGARSVGGDDPNRLESIRKMAGKLRAAKGFWPCYEASPTGYVRYWQRTHFGVDAGGVASGSSESRHRVRTGRGRRRETGALVYGGRCDARLGFGRGP